MSKRLLILSAIYLLAACIPVKAVSDEIKSLIENKQYETARVLIEATLLQTDDKTDAYLTLSTIIATHQTFQSEIQAACNYFLKCLDTLPSSGVKEETIEDVEKQLETAALYRLRGMYDISDSIVNTLEKKYENYSSIYYEKASLNANQSSFSDFFQNFYKGYKLNPENPRKWAGLAVINTIIGRYSPDVDNFYWLKAAIVQYDNPYIWANVMLELKRYDALEEETIERYGGNIPDNIRSLFYYYYYLTKDNQQKVKEIADGFEYKQNDKRLSSCFAQLISLEDQNRTDILKIITKPEGDFYECMYYYYNFWLSYWSTYHWTEETPSCYIDYLHDINKYFSKNFPHDQAIKKYNKILNWVVFEFLKRLKHKEAIDILNESLSDLDVNNLELLSLIYQNVGNKEKYIEVLEQIIKTHPENSSVGKTLITNSIFKRDMQKARDYISQIKEDVIPSETMKKYESILNGQKNPNLKKMTIKKSGKYCLYEEQMDWRKWKPVDACALQSIYYIFDFWGKENNDYNDISKNFENENIYENYDTINGIASFIESQGYNTYLLPPISEAIKRFIDKNIPLILLDRRTFVGFNIGHASIICGYDDLQEIFLLDDTGSGVGESSIAYDDIVEARCIIAPVPVESDKIIPDIPDLDKINNITRKKVFDQKDIDTLVNIDSSIEYWCYFNNGEYSHKQKDVNDCITNLEIALSLRKPKSSLIYEYLDSIIKPDKDYEKEMEYIDKGLEIQPTLNLLERKIMCTMRLADSIGKTDANFVDKLLDATETMESINPDYPPTYIIRADIYGKYTANFDYVLNEFNSYRVKFAQMDETWKQKNKQLMEKTQQGLAICKSEIRKKITNEKKIINQIKLF